MFVFICGEWHYLGGKKATACGISVEERWQYALTPVATKPHCHA